jgi:putative peptidoglycan lipid II flippase
LLASSTCIGAAVNSYLLWRGLRRSDVYRPRPGWGALFARVVVANIAMAALLWWLSGSLVEWLAMAPLARATKLALCIVAAAAAYFAALFAAGLRLRHVRTGGAA